MNVVNPDEYFGSKAGVVWACLHENGPLAITALKRKTKLNDKELYAALGWLACERKMDIRGDAPLLFRFALRE